MGRPGIVWRVQSVWRVQRVGGVRRVWRVLKTIEKCKMKIG